MAECRVEAVELDSGGWAGYGALLHWCKEHGRPYQVCQGEYDD